MPRAAIPSGRKSLLLVALIIAFIGGAWWWQRPPPEPIHNGRKLSELLGGTFPEDFGEYHTQEIRDFGPPAVLWLGYIVEHGRHPHTPHGPLPLDKAPAWLRQWLPARWGGLRGVSAMDERAHAAKSLRAFGPDAAPAIRALARSLVSNDDDDWHLVRESAKTLLSLGTASWPVVLDALEHGGPSARENLIGYLRVGFMDGKVPPELEADMTRVAAVFVKAFEDPNTEVRAQALDAAYLLCVMRPVARDLFYPAVPALRRLLSDPDKRCRTAAEDALSVLDGPAGRKSPAETNRPDR